MIEERNKIYHLFQAENGKWGTTDSNGQIYDNPEYERHVRDDGKVIYYTGDALCTFSQGEGMELIAYCEPWWDMVFSLARFPDEYNIYLDKHLHNPQATYPHILQSVAAIASQRILSAIQLHVLGGIKQFVECELNFSDPMDDSDEVVYNQWIANWPSLLSNQECVEILLPIMRSTEIAEIDKEYIWFGLFIFIDFITAMNPKK